MENYILFGSSNGSNVCSKEINELFFPNINCSFANASCSFNGVYFPITESENQFYVSNSY
jgi:hypothetical protein